MNTSTSYRRYALFALLGASVLMTMLAWQGPVLGYDDENLMAEVVGKSPWDFFTGLFYYAYLPFYGLSYWADVTIAGGWVHADWLHFVNALWHAATGYAVFCLLLRLLDNRGGALLGALLFVLHPMHVESAAWIAGRKELVSGFFFFLAWIFHLRSEDEGPRYAAGAAICFLVACLAKAAAIVLPALLLAAALLLPRYQGRRKTAAWRTAYLWLIAIIPLVIHLSVGFEKGVIREIAEPGQRVLWGIKAWGDTLRRAIFPFGLSIEYADVRTASWGSALLSGLWLLGAVAGIFALRRRAPFVSFGLACFLLAMAPFNNVFPASDVLAADRYAYLPLFGLAIAGGWALSLTPKAGLAGAAVLALYLALSGWGSLRFASDEILWTRTIEAQSNAAIAWLNRGVDRVTRAERAIPPDAEWRLAGIGDLRKGIELAQRDRIRARAHLALVLPLLQAGEAGEALQHADRALELVPSVERPDERRHRAQALYNRGVVRKTLGGFAVAAQDFEFSAKAVPDYDSYREAGVCYFLAEDWKNARIWLNAAAERDRAAVEPLVVLARTEARAGNREGELAALQRAATRASDDPQVVAGWVEYQLGGRSPNYKKAKVELERLPSHDPKRRKLLAAIEARRALYLFRRGEVVPAVEAADAARAAELGKSRTLYELGEVYLAAGRYDSAAKCFLGAADVLDEKTRWRDAAARAYALKAHARGAAGDRVAALRAFRAALAVDPKVIEAGMAPLRGEIGMLAESENDDIALLAIAAVAGDPAAGRRAADAIFAAEPEGEDLVLALRIRALLRVFVTRDFEGAESDLKEVLVRKPGDLWARYRLAQARMRNGVGWLQTAEAIKSVERREQGLALLNDAVAMLTRLVEERPDFVLARLLRGETFFSLDDQIGAKADYQRVRERAPDLKEVYLREAVLHRLVYVKGGSTENLNAGVTILEKALELDPNYFDALFELGNMHHLLFDRPEGGEKGSFPEFAAAILAYRRAMAVNPRAREPREEWARICLKMAADREAGGRLNHAHQLLLQVAKDASDIPALHKARLRLNLQPNFPRAAGISIADAFKGAWEAIGHIERLSPDDPELPLLRALYYRRLGGSYYITWVKVKGMEAKNRVKAKAVEAFRKALEAAPDDPENVRVRESLRTLAPEYIKIDQRAAKAAYESAVALFDQKKYAESLAGFRKAYQLFPEASQLRFMYGLALARALRLDEAKEHLSAIANSEDAPEFPAAMFELGQISLAQRNPEAAKAWFKRYLEFAPKDDPAARIAREHLEKLRGTQGD
ncbi:MAG: tetratricopeptide repeat protein [Planctomycetota bacterium]